MSVRRLASVWAFGFALAACGSNEAPVGDPSPEDAGGEAGASSQPDDTVAAGAGGDAAGAGVGGTASEPRCPLDSDAPGGAGGAETGPGCLTLEVPAGTFLVSALSSEDPGDQFTQVGPWIMTFRATAPGQLEAAVVSSHSNLWARNGFEAAAFDLSVDEHGVFRLPPGAKATLATYAYAEDRVPGLCLHRDSISSGDPANGRGSELRFYDTSGDGVADAITLRGSLVTLGLRGGDYEDDCGDEGAPLHADGQLIDWTIDLKTDGDAMRSRLMLDGGFLREGTVVIGDGIDITPLSASGFIYGFEAAQALEPGSALDWLVEGVDNLGRPFSSLDENVSFGKVEPWLPVLNSGFETLVDGQRWGDGPAVARESFTYLGGIDALELPPIEGARSLLLVNDVQPGGSRFRLVRSAGQTHLSFLAFGVAAAEAAVVGGEPTKAFEVTDADCSEHTAFCAATEGLRKYTLELPAGTEDVLLSIYDHSEVFGVHGSRGVWLDELRLDP